MFLNEERNCNEVQKKYKNEDFKKLEKWGIKDFQ